MAIYSLLKLTVLCANFQAAIAVRRLPGHEVRPEGLRHLRIDRQPPKRPHLQVRGLRARRDLHLPGLSI